MSEWKAVKPTIANVDSVGRSRVSSDVGCLAAQIERQQSGVRIG